MGIILSALAGAGNAGVDSMGKRIDQMNRLDIDAQRSALEERKALTILAATKQAQIDTANQLRTEQVGRLASAKEAVIAQALNKEFGQYEAAAAGLPTGGATPLTLEQQKVIDETKGTVLPAAQAAKASYAQTLADDPHSYIAAAMQTGDIDPKTVAELAQQADALKRQAASQEAQFAHSDASQAQAQKFAAEQQGRAQAFQSEQDRKQREALASGAVLPQETVAMMAEQYLAGDTSVMQNLGRGAQGAQNIIRLREEIARQAKAGGKGGADLAAQNAEYFGTKAGQRSAGTRIANVEMASYEAESLIPLARDASAAVARSGFLPFGKAQVMFDVQTNDPAMRQFAAANNALVNVYSRAISPTGTPTVADKEHAREMIATAMNDKSYQAVLDQMQKEITAARAAPQAVRKAFNAAVTGKGHGDGIAPTGGMLTYDPKTGTFH